MTWKGYTNVSNMIFKFRNLWLNSYIFLSSKLFLAPVHYKVYVTWSTYKKIELRKISVSLLFIM